MKLFSAAVWSAAFLVLSPSLASSATLIKADNSDVLSSSTSWVIDEVPTALDIGRWDSTVLSANTVGLGGNLSLLGLSITNPGGAVSISAGNTLTLGTSGMDMSSATQNLTLGSALTLGTGGQTWNVATGRTLTVSGAITQAAGASLLVDRTTNTGTITASPTLVNSITPWGITRSAGTAANSTAAGYNFATVTSGNLVPYTAATALTAAGAWGGTPSGGTGVINYDVSGGFAATGLQRHFNSLRYTGTAAVTQTTNNHFIALIVNSIMNAGGNTMTIGGASVAGSGSNFMAGVMPTTATHNLVLVAANNNIIFDGAGRIANAGSTNSGTTITNGGTAGAVTILGPSTVEMRGQALHTGATYVNSGTLLVSGAGTWNNTSAIHVNGSGAKYLHTSSVASTRTINLTRGTVDGTGALGTVSVGDGTGGILTNGNGGTGTLTSSAVTFTGDATFNANVATGITPLAITGALTTTPANGPVTINVNFPGGVTNGTHNLISFGSFAGTASDFVIGTGFNSRQSANLAVNGNNLQLTVAGDAPKWTGAVSSEWSTATLAAPKNWLLITGGTQTDFISGDTVLFDDTATGFTTVDISTANVSPATITLNNSSKTYSFTTSAGMGITGSSSLTMNGTGTVNLGTVNAYTGATMVNAGVLNLTGALSGSAVTVASGATLTQSSGSSISAGTSLTANGTATLNGAVSGAAITVGAGATLSQAATGSISGTGTFTNNGTVTLAGTNNYTGATNINAAASLTLNGSLNGSAVTVATGGTLTESSTGSIQGAVGLTLNGTATLSGANTLTGTTAYNAGASLTLKHANALNTTANVSFNATGLTLTFASDTSVLPVPINTSTGHVQNFVSDRATPGAGLNHGLTTPAALGIGGTTLNFTSGANVTSGTGSFTFTQLGMSSGTGGAQVVLNPTSATVSVGNLFKVLNNASPVVVLGGTSAGNAITGVISNGAILVAPNVLSIIKSGSSVWTLSGANTYGGTTAVNEGTLVINGTHTGTGATTVGGATATGTPLLLGTGTLAGALTIAGDTTVGTLNPGTVGSIGTFTAGSTVITGVLAVDISGANADRLVANGNLDISGGTLQLSGTPTAGSYIIASCTGTLTGSTFASITPSLPAGYILNANTNLKQVRIISTTDTDSDGLYDWWELANFPDLVGQTGTDDSDADGFTNLQEFTAGTAPNNGSFTPNDVDGDGLLDTWEVTHFGSTAAGLPTLDPDADFATNLQESQGGQTNPKNRTSFPDTDTDGLPDAWENHYFTNLAQAATDDPDVDGATNLQEFTANSHPNDVNWSPTKSKLDHRWSFTNDLTDSIGTSPATLIDPDSNNAVGGVATLGATSVTLAGGAWASSDYVRLGGNLLSGKKTPVTLEIWASQNTVQNWSRIFDAGTNTSEYLTMAWTQGTTLATDSVQWTDASAANNTVNTNQPYTLGTEFHIVMVIEPGKGAGGTTRVTWYRAASAAQPGAGTPTADMGPQRGTFDTTNTLEQFVDTAFDLGRSQFTADATANATYNEVRLYSGALTAGEIELNHDLGVDSLANTDSDVDGLPDGYEVLRFGSLAAQTGSGDADSDTYTNFQEYVAGSDPNLAASTPLDVDADGLPDSYEVTTFGTTTAQTGSGDPDFDYATNLQEYAANTNPLLHTSFPDTDADTLNDGWEMFFFSSLNRDGTGDFDSDGVTDLAEFLAKSHPADAAWTPTKAKIKNRWSFTNDLTDSVGGSTASIQDPNGATASNAVTLGATDLLITGGAKATSDHVQLGTGLIGSGRKAPVTIELWATQVSVQNWSRIFDFGSSTTETMFMSWTRGTTLAQDRVEWVDAGVTSGVSDSSQPYTLGTEFHIIMTVEPGAGASGTTKVTWYRAAAGSSSLGAARGTYDTTNRLATLVDAVNNLGQSQYADNVANARYNEVRIYNGALTEFERELSHDLGVDTLAAGDTDSDGLVDGWEVFYFGSIAAHDGTADPDADLFTNAQELAAATVPNNKFSSPDTDADGLADGYEVHWFSLVGETLAQVIAKYNATSDPDADGFTNAQESAAITGQTPNPGTNPTSASSTPVDADADGLADVWEIAYFSSHLTRDGTGDFDSDGSTDAQEFAAGSSPTSNTSTPTDTDGNGQLDSLVNLRPYSADASTLHLWHLDTAGAPVPDLGTQPQPLRALEFAATLMDQSLGGFGRALNTFPGASATASETRLGAVAAANSALGTDNVPMTLWGSDGSFTLEALVRPLWDVTQTPAHNNEIIAYDDEGNAGRVFQFRISYNGTQPRLEFANINGGTSQNMFADIPITGTHAITTGKWFHVAVTYNGQQGTANNFRFYWTVVDGAQNQGVEIPMTAGSGGALPNSMTNDLLSVVQGSDFTLGNRGRSPESENFMGNLDEVRISSVARSAVAGFAFPPPVPAAPTDLVATKTATAVVLGWTNNSADATQVRIERSTTAGSGFSVIGTVAGTVNAFTDSTTVPNTTYFYRVYARTVGANDTVDGPASAEATAKAPIYLANNAVGVTNISSAVELTSTDTLTFDIASTGVDKLVLTGGLSLTTSPVQLVFHVIDDPLAGTYDLIEGLTGQTTADFAIPTSINGLATSLSIASGTLRLTLSGVAVPISPHWRGDLSTLWSGLDGVNTNWDRALTGGLDTQAAPGSLSTVYFSATANAGNTASTTLGADFSIRSLRLLAAQTTPVGIGGTHKLTLSGDGQTPNVALQLESGAGPLSLSSEVALAQGQTWENLSANGVTVSGTISGDHALTLSGTGSYTLSGSNSFTGGLALATGSSLNLNSAAALGTGPVTLNTSSLGNTSGAAIELSTANNITLAGNLTFTGPSSLSLGTSAVGWAAARTIQVAAGSLTLPGMVTGAAALTKIGPGSLILSGGGTLTGVTTVSDGVLSITGTSLIGQSIAVTGTGSLQVPLNALYTINNSTAPTFGTGTTSSIAGTVAGMGGTSIISGGAVLDVSGTLSPINTGSGGMELNAASGTTAVLNVLPGANIVMGGNRNGNTNASYLVSVTAGGTGIVNMSGGSLQTGTGGQRDLQVSRAGHGVFNLTDGSVFLRGYLVAGISSATAVGVVNISGGSITVDPVSNVGGTLAATAGATGEMNVSGGSYISIGTGAAAGIYVGEAGPGVLNVTGTGLVDLGGSTAAAGLVIGRNTGSTGIVNLWTGGVIETTRVQKAAAATSGVLNFHGGTLRADATTANTSTFESGLTAINVWSEGGIIDNNGAIISINTALSAPAGKGASALSPAAFTGATGYTTAPYVSITGGTGTGMTAKALINGTGDLTSFIITNPGTGYADGDTITVSLNGGGKAAAITSTTAVTLADNTSGGMTFRGTGTTSLNGALNFTGPIVFESGKVLINSPFTTPSLSIPAGASFGGANTLSIANLTILGKLTPGYATSSGTLIVNGAVTIASGGSLVLRLESSTAADKLIATDVTLTGRVEVNLFPSFNVDTLLGGETFDLLDWTGTLSAPTFNVATDLVLPDLSADGWGWDRSSFLTDGTVRIINIGAPIGRVNLTATGQTSSSASVQGQILDQGAAAATVEIYYGEADGLKVIGNWASHVTLSGTYATSATFQQTLSGLLHGTKYYYRARLTNASGSRWSQNSSWFITQGDVPLTNWNFEDGAVANNETGVPLTGWTESVASTASMVGYSFSGDPTAMGRIALDTAIQQDTSEVMTANTRYKLLVYVGRRTGVTLTAGRLRLSLADSTGTVWATRVLDPSVNEDTTPVTADTATERELSLDTIEFPDAVGKNLRVVLAATTGPAIVDAVRVVKTTITQGGRPIGEILPVEEAEVNYAYAKARVTNRGSEDALVTFYIGTVDRGVTTQGWDNAVTASGLHGSGADVAQLIPDLTPLVTYYCRATLTNNFGTTWARGVSTFVIDTNPASAANLAASQITPRRATVGGSVAGRFRPYVMRIYYGTTDGGTDGGAWANSEIIGSVKSSGGTELIGLLPETNYFYRVFVQSSYPELTPDSAWAPSSGTFTTAPRVAPTTHSLVIVTKMNDFTEGQVSGEDVDYFPITFAKVTDPAHGSVTFQSNGSFRYTPNHDYTGPDSFTFKAISDGVDSAPSTVAISITAGPPNWVWTQGANVAGNKGSYGTKGVTTTTNIPGARQDAASAVDATGNLWLFGGTGWATSTAAGALNDLWKRDATTGQWTWISGANTTAAQGIYGTKGVAAAGNTPGARAAARAWFGTDGHLYLFAGIGRDSGALATSTGPLNDLWRYNTTTGEWTWLSGSDVLKQGTTLKTNGVYGSQGVAAPTNTPGGRSGHALWQDAQGHVYVFGGKGLAATGTAVGNLSDLWHWDGSQWTWLKGASTLETVGTYGSLGTGTTTTQPGARTHATTWQGRDGSLWLFGGNGKASTTATGNLNDLWRYDTHANRWTWVRGANTINAVGTYGRLGINAPTNQPGARQGAVAWLGADGSLWLFGGQGTAYWNDVWSYSIDSNQWTWIKGPATASGAALYGTLNTPAVSNTPGARKAGIAWADSVGDLWTFGGGQATHNNDVWKLDLADTATAQTLAAANITDTTVELQGSVHGHGAVVSSQFTYWTAGGSSQSSPPAAGNSGDSPLAVATALTGLTPGTTYYYRCEALTPFSTAKGQVMSFTTTGTAPTAELQFVQTAVSVTESSGQATLQVDLGTPATASFTVAIQLTGSARNPQDYIPQATSIHFSPGQQFATIGFTIVNDTVGFSNETITVTLGTPSIGSILVGDSATITIYDDDVAPVITSPIGNQVVLAALGSNTTLTVTANGTLPFTYQWQKAGIAIATAKSASYTLTGTAMTTAGVYNCKVTNPTGTTTSGTFTLDVVDRAGKAPVQLAVGGTTTFTVPNSKSAGLTYRWYRVVDPQDSGTWTQVVGTGFSGTTTDTLTVSNAQLSHAGIFACRVTRGAAVSPLIYSGFYTLEVGTVSVPALTTITTLPTAVVGASYSYQIAYDPSVLKKPTSFTLVGLPPGLTCSSTGLISGKVLTTALTTGTTSAVKNITIQAKNTAGNALTTPMPVTLRVLAVPSTALGSFIALAERTSLVNQSLGAKLELTSTSAGSFTAKLNLGITPVTSAVGTTVPMVHTLDSGGTSILSSGGTAYFTRTGGASTLRVDFTLTGNTLTGTLTDPSTSGTANLTGIRNTWSTIAPIVKATHYKGQYNLLLEPAPQHDGDVDVPQGNGFASFTIAEATGAFTMAGKTSDGLSVSSAAFVGTSGEVYMFSSLGSTLGTLMGQASITLGGAAPAYPDNMLSGTATWKRLPVATTNTTERGYRSGFDTVSLLVQGSKYNGVSNGGVVMDLPNSDSNAKLRFAAGGLTLGQVADQTFSIRNTGTLKVQTIKMPAYSTTLLPNPNPNKVSFTLAASPLGQFSGSFTLANPTATLTRPAVPYTGIIIRVTPTSYKAAGYFMLPQLPQPGQTVSNSPTLSGQVELLPSTQP